MENRDPKDIDAVTFIDYPRDISQLAGIIANRDDLLNNETSKQKYHVDHFIVPLCSEPELLVDHSRYWFGLFSHRRDATWKGMLRVQLNDINIDVDARQFPESKS